MKKFLLLLAGLLTLSVAANARKVVFQDGDWLYAVNPDADNEVAVVQYQGKGGSDATELTIPSYATNNTYRYFVTELGEGLFAEYSNDDLSNYTKTWSHNAFTKLEKVTIPSTVTKIGNKAFKGCTALASISLPNSVTSIGYYAFMNCTALTSIPLPNSVTSIREYAFTGCTALTTITIPSSVTSIGDYANRSICSHCTSLQEIIVEEGNSNYASMDGVLYNKTFTEILNYPAGKEDTTFEIPNSVTRIGGYAFAGCTALTTITIPSSVTQIGRYAFDSTNLTSVAIPNSVAYIDEGAFYDCTGLISVTLPNSVTQLWYKTFAGCTSLTSVTIPASVTKIESGAFNDCTALKTIYALPTTPPTTSSYAFKTANKSAVVYIPKGTLKAYFVAVGWTYFTDFREMGALGITLSESNISIEEGKTTTLTATVTKDSEVTVESESWTSSDPEVATVDNDGLITAVGVGTATISYNVVDGYGCPHAEYCTVTVTANAGIDAITADDSDAPAEFYTLSGVRISGQSLTPGLYIKRQGNKVSKVIVK